MDIHFTHKPDYFFFAERFIGFLQQKITLHPKETHLHFALVEIYEAFQEDLASTTINLDSILNIVDHYQVNTYQLINSYIIDAKNDTLDLEINRHALSEFKNGHQMTAPDPTLYQ